MTQQCPEIDKTSDAYRFKGSKTIINLNKPNITQHRVIIKERTKKHTNGKESEKEKKNKEKATRTKSKHAIAKDAQGLRLLLLWSAAQKL